MQDPGALVEIGELHRVGLIPLHSRSFIAAELADRRTPPQIPACREQLGIQAVFAVELSVAEQPGLRSMFVQGLEHLLAEGQYFSAASPATSLGSRPGASAAGP